jgi:hypothetical protein
MLGAHNWRMASALAERPCFLMSAISFAGRASSAAASAAVALVVLPDGFWVVGFWAADFLAAGLLLADMGFKLPQFAMRLRVGKQRSVLILTHPVPQFRHTLRLRCHALPR